MKRTHMIATGIPVSRKNSASSQASNFPFIRRLTMRAKTCLIGRYGSPNFGLINLRFKQPTVPQLAIQ